MTTEQWPDALWYLARGTGVVALVLLTIVVVLGVGARSGRPAFGLPRFGVALVHRNASLIAVVLLAVHVTTMIIDPFVQLHLVDAVLPFVGAYRPLWLGLGTLASDLLLVVILTSLLRHRLGPRIWRSVHWLAYAAWPVAMLHSLGTGSDAGSGWLRVIAIACAVAVLAAVAWRVSTRFAEAARRSRGQSPTTLAATRLDGRR